MVDIATRYCILDTLPDKSSDTVVQATIKVFSDYGFPLYICSDNSTEFVNTLMEKLTKASGSTHIRSTPYHPQGNSVAERYVQTVINIIRKNVQGATHDCDLYVKPAQLALNNKVAGTHGSTPFTLMFNRTMNGFNDYTKNSIPRQMTEEEL